MGRANSKRLFRLRTAESENPCYYTWVLANGKQVLLGGCVGQLVCAQFNPAGKLVAEETRPFPRDMVGEDGEDYVRRRPAGVVAWWSELGAKQGSIEVRHFYLHDPGIGISPYPQHLHYLERDDEDEDSDPTSEAIEAWREIGRFVFHWGSSEYYMNA